MTCVIVFIIIMVWSADRQSKFQKLSHICKPFLKSNHKIKRPYTNTKYYTNIKHKFSVSAFSIALVKRGQKERKKRQNIKCWYCQPFCLIYKEMKEFLFKGMDRNSYKRIMTNTSAIWREAANTTYQLLSSSCSTRQVQKSLYMLTKNHADCFKRTDCLVCISIEF